MSHARPRDATHSEPEIDADATAVLTIQRAITEVLCQRRQQVELLVGCQSQILGHLAEGCSLQAGE